MPRTITRRYTTAALAAVTVLTVWLGPRVDFVARAESATPSAVRFEFSAAYYRVSEGENGATITVVRTGDINRDASVAYLADNNYLYANGCGYVAWVGSATPGVDYARVSGTLRFAAGETSKTFSVSIIDDAQIESRQPEMALLSLDFSGEAPPSGTDCYGAAATLYIHDNDSTSPTPSPSNKRKIAFGSNRDGNAEIYVMDEDGTGVRRLTDTLASEGYPSWSPDGTRLVFVSDRDVRNGIYLMNADGTNVNRLAGVTGENPIWSPDGNRIAFTGTRTFFSYEIYVVNIDGTGLLNVTNNPQEDFAPAWSPDGKRLAFTSRRDNGTYSVYVVNADGTGTRRVVEGYSREPAWSPDGTRIAYVAQGEQNDTNIYVVNADGTGKKLLSGGRAFSADLSPAWSPDGARIAFISNRDRAPGGSYEIYVMNADGGGQTRLTNDEAHDDFPVWQPQTTAQADVRFEFSAFTYWVSEGEGGATITIVRKGDTTSEASVEYLADNGQLSPKGCQWASFAPTATADGDYTRTSGTLRFAAGETSKTFRVSITDDAEIEGRLPEGAFLSLDFSPAGPTSGGACYGAFADFAIFDNDSAAAPSTSAPVLLTEPNTIWAVALDSVTQVAEPFAKVSASNFSIDRRTRVSLFASGVNSPSVTDIVAEAEDSSRRRYQLTVEHVASVPGLDWMSQVIVRLPDGLESTDYVWVGLNIRGTPTNQAVINIQRKP